MLIATAIITTLLAGRVHFLGYLAITFLFAGLIQPILMHWVWAEDGWLHDTVFLKYQMCFKDNGGGLVVHTSSATAGLVGSIFLGRRLLKLQDIDESSIGQESPGTTMTGYVFIILGIMAFSLVTPIYETTHYPFNYIGYLMVNNLMAMSAGMVVSVFFNFIFSRNTFNYWIILRCMQGSVASLVILSPGIDVYNPISSFGIGIMGGITLYATTRLIQCTSIEDYCNIISIHFACGFLGCLLPPFLGGSENLGTSVSYNFRILHMIWQLLGLLCVITCIVIIFSFFFFLLYVSGFLRNQNEKLNHKRSINVSRTERRCCLQKLFATRDETPILEPGPSGRDPNIALTFKKSQNFERNKEEPPFNIINNNERDSRRQERRIIYADSVETHRQNKQIYTMHNIITNPVVHVESTMKCAGDFITDMKRQPFDNPNKITTSNPKMKPTKTKSFYVLHRTRKHLNLNRTRRKVKQTTRAKNLVKYELVRSKELIEYDEKMNDGFITYKLPPKTVTK